MIYIKRIEVNNFKIFHDRTELDFDENTVIIGPNNSGKTSIIQALAMWHFGVQTFFDSKLEQDKISKTYKAKGKLTSATGIGINRLDIAQVPMSDTRQLWNKANIRKGSVNEKISISVSLNYNNEIKECKVEFKYFKSELLYVYLSDDLANEPNLLAYAANLKINLLYPMSGLATEETLLQEGAIRKQIGAGRTANVLRNICYALHSSQEDDWKYLVNLIDKMFNISLNEPQLLASADIILEYNYTDPIKKTEKDLSIMQAGRGQQQMILIIAFVLWKKSSILLIDEPDAHLEILRQNQVLDVLKEMSVKYNNQIIIATHSEVIMNDCDKLIFLIDGKKVNIGEDTKPIKSALRDYGIEHYYKAQIHKRILYVEGTTDKSILKAISEKLDHPLAGILNNRIFIYYTQNIHPSNSLIENGGLDNQSGYFYNHKKHFQALSPVVDGLKGVAILDSDGSNKIDEESGGLTVLFWSDYEIENYIIKPQSVFSFVESEFDKTEGPLFTLVRLNSFKDCFNTHFMLPLFKNNPLALSQFNDLPKELQNELYKSQASSVKTSKLLEDVFDAFADREKGQILLKKADYYRITHHCNSFDIEVKTKLDKLFNILS